MNELTILTSKLKKSQEPFESQAERWKRNSWIFLAATSIISITALVANAVEREKSKPARKNSAGDSDRG